MLKIEEPRVSREPIVKIKASPGGDAEDNSVSFTNASATLEDNRADLKAKYPLMAIRIGFQMLGWS